MSGTCVCRRGNQMVEIWPQCGCSATKNPFRIAAFYHRRVRRCARSWMCTGLCNVMTNLAGVSDNVTSIHLSGIRVIINHNVLMSCTKSWKCISLNNALISLSKVNNIWLAWCARTLMCIWLCNGLTNTTGVSDNAIRIHLFALTLTVLVTTIDALRHFETG